MDMLVALKEVGCYAKNIGKLFCRPVGRLRVGIAYGFSEPFNPLQAYEAGKGWTWNPVEVKLFPDDVNSAWELVTPAQLEDEVKKRDDQVASFQQALLNTTDEEKKKSIEEIIKRLMNASAY